ncbi:Eukaryotic aspartyl protease family protein [Zostera marina]|uniref:Eukaryotic aspartyl protease family protein n=1 Tax=Zostera marina TaxID=29655 RepID=A0A0K9PCZ4_ZOSMR|nr:Eukaryotic aspartyl protease family protein [Zostera marina]
MAPSLPPAVLLSVIVLLGSASFLPVTVGTGVFKLTRKFSSKGRNLEDFRSHDSRRRGRFLNSIEISLGGVGSPTSDGLYYAQIWLGTPSQSYHVQLDTGSDILWVNCYNCRNCPKKTDLGFNLRLYNPRESSTGRLVACNDNFCSLTYNGEVKGCYPGVPCQYQLLYGDGSGTTGFFITDSFKYDRVIGSLKTVHENASISFGCGAEQSGQLDGSSDAVDGIFGFGQANSSMISQLAALGKVNKMFAHCLDTQNGGGGIFTIGNVVEPKLPTTPMVPNQPHYNINLKGMAVGGNELKLPTDLFDTSGKTGTIIDSGTTLAYLPQAAIKLLMAEIVKPGMSVIESQGFSCFRYSNKVDDGFPTVSFHFVNDLELKVYPHDYLFQLEDDLWCVGFQSSTSQSNDKEYFLLGDLVLTNKLVFYDLESQAIGWKEYNCSSTIGVQDAKSGSVYTVGSTNLSSLSSRLGIGSGALFIVLISSVLNYFVH